MDERTRVHTSFADVSHDRTLYHVPHCESFNRLVFGYRTAAVRTAHEIDMSPSFLVAATISSFLSLQKESQPNSKSSILRTYHPARSNTKLSIICSHGAQNKPRCTILKTCLPYCNWETALEDGPVREVGVTGNLGTIRELLFDSQIR